MAQLLQLRDEIILDGSAAIEDPPSKYPKKALVTVALVPEMGADGTSTDALLLVKSKKEAERWIGAFNKHAIETAEYETLTSEADAAEAAALMARNQAKIDEEKRVRKLNKVTEAERERKVGLKIANLAWLELGFHVCC